MSQYLSANFVSVFTAIFSLSTGHWTQVLVYAKHTFYCQASPLALQLLVGLQWAVGGKKDIYMQVCQDL